MSYDPEQAFLSGTVPTNVWQGIALKQFELAMTEKAIASGELVIQGGPDHDNVNLIQENQQLFVNSKEGHDYITAGSSNDFILCGSGDDFAKGWSGIDRLFGQGGKDYLHGQSGSDLIDGGQSSDILIGGSDPDIFIQRTSDAGTDRITDFRDIGDKIIISGGDWKVTRTNNGLADQLLLVHEFDRSTKLITKIGQAPQAFVSDEKITSDMSMNGFAANVLVSDSALEIISLDLNGPPGGFNLFFE